ncbi:sodium/hydrogen exchanger 4 [Fagus crenata]
MASISVFQCVYIVFLLAWISDFGYGDTVFDVMKDGAVADGKTDNSKVFENVFQKACQSEGMNVVLIPQGTYLLYPIILKGPCKGQVEFQIKGTLKASTDKAHTINVNHWITFQYIDQLVLSGGGTLDGQGTSAWDDNTCSKDPNCKSLPISLRFDFVTNSRISHLTSINSKNAHVNLFGCKGIMVVNVKCGPGHGVSVGSLGGSAGEEDVSGLVVTNCTFTGTDNGVRVKTWAKPYASNVFNSIAHLPIGDSQIQIHNVKYRNIRGTSSTKIAVAFECSKVKPCEDIELKEINLAYQGADGPVASSCSNVKGVASGEQQPPSCV